MPNHRGRHHGAFEHSAHFRCSALVELCLQGALRLEELQDDPDELVTQISGNVFAQLIAAESERAKRLPMDAMGIWEHCQLAASYFRRWDVSIETMSRALDAQSGRYAEARAALDRVKAIAPEGGLSGFHRWHLGYVAYAAGDYEDALPYLKAQGRLTPSWAACYALTAISCFILGDEDEARKYIAKAKDPNPHLRPEKIVGMVRTQQDRDKGAREYAILEQLWREDLESTKQS